MSHNHGGGCSHDHSHDDISDPARGNQFSLYLKIDTDRVVCLNEAEEESGKTVFKPWDQKLDKEKVSLLSPMKSSWCLLNAMQCNEFVAFQYNNVYIILFVNF